MNHALMDKIAQAVLYEGYILYPYRPSVKNRHRWTFGGLFPQAYSETHATGDAWFLQSEFIVTGTEATQLESKVRFLHLVDRRVARLCESRIEFVDSLMVGEKKYQPWQEAVEREVLIASVSLGKLCTNPVRQNFKFPSSETRETIVDENAVVVGWLIREQRQIEGAVVLTAARVEDGVFKISIRVSNCTDTSAFLPLAALRINPHPTRDAASDATRDNRFTNRDYALLQSFCSTHVAMGLTDGQFVSPTDPPDHKKQAVSDCNNIGVWPVLVGEAGDTDALLASPIILSDYPQIAPESPGDLFDGGEIDEILTLRIMTLTDEEKRDVAGVDPRAEAMLKRTESLAREQLMSLHGTMRETNPFAAGDIFPAWDVVSDKQVMPTARSGGVDLHPGDRVRLCPRGGADAFDIVLNGKIATIAKIEQDFEDRIHLAVTVDDDPGADFGKAGKPGHRFFFRLDEVEPIL